MQDLIAVKRYVEGYLAYCGDTIGRCAGLEELRKLSGIMERAPGLRLFLESGVIGREEKRRFVDTVLGNELSGECCDLIRLLLERGRIRSLSDIVRYAIDHYLHDDQPVVLETAGMVDTEELRRFKAALERRTGRRIRLYRRFDPEMIGGFRLIAGGQVIDASLARSLNDMRRMLANIRMEEDEPQGR